MGKPHAVMGYEIPAPRATLAGRFWLACALSVPVFALLCLAELAWRFWPF